MHATHAAASTQRVAYGESDVEHCLRTYRPLYVAIKIAHMTQFLRLQQAGGRLVSRDTVDASALEGYYKWARTDCEGDAISMAHMQLASQLHAVLGFHDAGRAQRGDLRGFYDVLLLSMVCSSSHKPGYRYAISRYLRDKVMEWTPYERSLVEANLTCNASKAAADPDDPRYHAMDMDECIETTVGWTKEAVRGRPTPASVTRAAANSGVVRAIDDIMSAALDAESKGGYLRPEHAQDALSFLEYMEKRGVFNPTERPPVDGAMGVMPMSGKKLREDSPLLQSTRGVAFAAKRAFENNPDVRYTEKSTGQGAITSAAVLSFPLSLVAYEGQLAAKKEAYDARQARKRGGGAGGSGT
jgi:hypothetical protein